MSNLFFLRIRRADFRDQLFILSERFECQQSAAIRFRNSASGFIATARIGVMEGDSAVMALYSTELEKVKGGPIPDELREATERTRADYER